jgi:hypothetical protein
MSKLKKLNPLYEVLDFVEYLETKTKKGDKSG